jgi:hypothetical protein
VTTHALHRQFEVNVFGPVLVTRTFLPLLREGHGRVVTIGGAAGRTPLPMYEALSASKAALDSISEMLRLELRHQGVHVSYIEPGAPETQFFKRAAMARRRAGYAGSAETQSIYAKAIEAAARAVAGSRASPVEHPAGAIERALTDRQPAPRDLVGRDARLVLPLLRRLPARPRSVGSENNRPGLMDLSAGVVFVNLSFTRTRSRPLALHAPVLVGFLRTKNRSKQWLSSIISKFRCPVVIWAGSAGAVGSRIDGYCANSPCSHVAEAPSVGISG